jgi:hypothetical protein
MLPRIGFIGCGAFSTSCLYPALRLLAFGLEPYGSEPEVDLVACCDMDQRLAERNARAFGFKRAYTNHRKMLEQEQLDTVFVVMHPFLQPSLVIEVMDPLGNLQQMALPAAAIALQLMAILMRMTTQPRASSMARASHSRSEYSPSWWGWHWGRSSA